MPLWCGMPPEQIELQYNPRHAVPDFQRHFQWREQESRSFRAANGAPHVLAYGAGPRQAVDIYALQGSRATLAFIHGGAWRAGDRANFHYMVPAMHALGFSLASIGYPLAPEAGMTEMAAAAAGAVAALTDHVSGPIILSGHSAGAQLASLLLLSHSAADRFSGALLISGLYDLAAVAQTTINGELHLKPEEIAAFTPFSIGGWSVPTCSVVGALETDAFKEESRRILALSPTSHSAYRVLADENHFSIVRQLADPASPLNAALIGLAGGR